jgi:hypothetical protein
MKHRKAEQKETKAPPIYAPKRKVEIKKIQLTEEDIKNMIMKEIVNKKDKKMLEQHKELFNKNETQYLLDKLEKRESN